MNKWTHKMSVLIIVMMLVLINMGCKSSNQIEYTGQYPELYSIAINSLLGSTGYAVSESRFDSQLKLIEEDTYGRKLFLFFENRPVSTYSLLISQKSDQDYAYFYPDVNFISIPKGEIEDLDLAWTSEDDFPIEKIEELKQKNNWGNTINLDQCIKVKVVDKKEKGTVNHRTLKQLYNQALGEDAYRHYQSYTYFLNSDEYGRSIYLGRGKNSIDRFVVMLFESDNSYDESKGVMDLNDLQNYQEELKAFKELNNWNQPFLVEE